MYCSKGHMFQVDSWLFCITDWHLFLKVYMESMFSCELFTSVFNLRSHNSEQLKVENESTYNF